VVLHRERGDVEAVEPLDDVVVEVVVTHLDTPEALARVAHPVDRRVDGEAVVVRGDLDPPGRPVEHRLVDAAVPERQLVGAEPEGTPEELVAEADAEVGQPRAQGGAQQLDVAVGCPGVARAVREEQGVGLQLEDLLGGDRLRQHVHVEAALGEEAERRGLHAEVEHGDRPDPFALRREAVGLGRRDRAREVEARHLGAAAHELELLARGEQRVGAREDAGAHGPGRADVAGDRTRVDAADADDARRREVVVEAPLRAEVRHDAGGVAHDEAGDPDLRGLHVLVVHARVADVRRGHEHDLSGVGGVGERLLVAGHAGREHGLAERAAASSVGASLVAGPVLEHEHGDVVADDGGLSHPRPHSPVPAAARRARRRCR
jgi:hypothetical protein